MQLTHDTADLPAMERSEAHYYDAFIRRAECYGGPPDTSKAVDSEGVLAYLRAVRLLHELTGKAVYLDHLRDALCYEYSFKFCYPPGLVELRRQHHVGGKPAHPPHVLHGRRRDALLPAPPPRRLH